MILSFVRESDERDHLGFNENIRSYLSQSCGTKLLVKLIKFMFSNFRSIIIASNYSLFSPLDTN